MNRWSLTVNGNVCDISERNNPPIHGVKATLQKLIKEERMRSTFVP